MGQPNLLLKEARENVGLLQTEIAQKLGVGVKTYSSWECGDHEPYLRHRRELAKVLKMSLEQVNALFRKETSPSSKNAPPSVTIELQDVSESIEEIEDYIEVNLSLRLLGIVDVGTYTDQCEKFSQVIEQFDAMNTENPNYQMTRRQAVRDLAAFPFVPPINLLKRDRVSSSHYELFLQECGASLVACEELAKSSDPDDLEFAFRCVCRYLVELEIICNSFSRYRTQALELAVHCAILKTALGQGRAGIAASLLFAGDAIRLAREFGDISWLLSAYSKRAWGYLYADQRGLALETARTARDLLEKHKDPLPTCIRGGTYSTFAIVQARNGLSHDTALKKASEQGPDNQVQYGMKFTGTQMLREQGKALYYAGKPGEALRAFAQIVDPETLEATKPFKGILTETQRIGIILDMSRASAKGKARNMGNAIRYWEEAIEGAKRLKNKSQYRRALMAYDLLDAAFPEEQEVHDLLDHTKNADKSLTQ